ncbi:UPF0696 protein C11orf68 homolog isoform X1 [Asterias rubens]|uniref:UPF0696 protein C11orf68 homolog isoform X1 n=1 Tax=Asterias rubens TaxID=7604 RepID=UPI001455022B|nr:UPF0696 protein C11orf68 homolog isoform X1 [Asterias rubens]
MEGEETNEPQPNDEGSVTASLANISIPASEANSPDHSESSQSRPETPSIQPQQITDPERSNRLFADSNAAGEEDTRLFNPLDYEDFDERQRSLDTFLDTYAPSKVKRSDGVGKIIVNSLRFKDEGLGDVEKIQEEFKKLSHEEVNWPTVRKLALTHRCKSGIWLVFQNTREKVDEAWRKIAKATVADMLGTHAKVTPTEDAGTPEEVLHSGQYVISVYAENFDKKDEVYNLEDKIRKLGMTDRMAFKPRVYSKIGVFSENKWGLRPGIYTSHWHPDVDESKIRDNEK